MFSMFVCLGTSKCLSVEIFDKYVNTSIFVDIFSCIFDVPMPVLSLFYVNYVSGYFKSTPSSEKWFEVFQESFKSHLKTFEHHTDCHTLTRSQARDNRHVNPSGVNNTFLELAQGWQITWSNLYRIITREYTKQNWKDKHNRYVYLYM